MNQRGIAVTTVTLLGFASTAAFAIQPNQYKGYNVCVREVNQDFRRNARLEHDKHYYLERDAQTQTYYINSRAWRDGQRTAFRTRCVTDIAGRAVRSRVTEPGRWTDDNRQQISIQEVSTR
jgi:hypothetical protein